MRQHFRAGPLLRKLGNNIVSPRARYVLGWRAYSSLLATFGLKLTAIARAGDLRPLDQSMGGRADTFRYGGRWFHFDCAFADELILDGSYAFGIVREILIRDCYLKHLPTDTLQQVETVVDLGANRGMFSMLAGTFARHVLSIEANPRFRPVIEHNARLNGFDHVSIETVFVGAGGSLGSDTYPREELSTLLDRHRVESIDLLKVDIEGSEFALFEKTTWLGRVRRLCMEVHHKYGPAEMIVDTLRADGFALAFGNGDLQRVAPERDFDFLYAWR